MGKQRTEIGTFSAPQRSKRAQNDGPRWWPWWYVWSLGGCSRERERESSQRERRGRTSRGVTGLLQGNSSVAWAASKRWPWWHLGASLQVLHEEDKRVFPKSPFGFRVVFGIFETTQVCNIL
jgi:hypothetical protein